MQSLFPKLKFNNSKQVKTLGHVQGLSMSAAIASIFFNHQDEVILVITKDNLESLKLKEQLYYLTLNPEIYIFPDYETLPYDVLSPHQDLISQRLELLAKIPTLKHALILCPITALMQRLCPTEFMVKNALYLKQGQILNLENLQNLFINAGYTKVEQVLSHGEFAVRGSLLDIFPMGSQRPYRIDFFDDEIDSIASFNLDTQRSEHKVSELKLLPAHEFPFDSEAIANFRSAYRSAFNVVSLQNHVIYQSVSKGAIPSGIEYYLPLFFNKTSSLFEYFNENLKVISTIETQKEAESFDKTAHQRKASFEGNADHPPLNVYRLFLSPKELLDNLSHYAGVNLLSRALDDSELKKRLCSNLKTQSIPPIAFNVHEKNASLAFCNFVEGFIKQGGRVLISAISEGRRQSLKEIIPQSLKDKFQLKVASSILDFQQSEDPLMMTVAPFDEGVIFAEDNLCFLTETEILGFAVVRQRRKRQGQISAEAMIQNLAQLTPGQAVVHIDHGIGLYKGLRTLTINGVKGEFLAIEYQNGDLLNIPITALNRVARYAGSENPELSRLGSDLWAHKKSKAIKRVRDVAAELLDLNAKRASREGIKFAIDNNALESFCAGFKYETTLDQQNAIEATLNDLSSGKPMDRLICGDVGFGKTEVALRAAFVASNDGYQVAVLVPTTVLAEQHYQNFKDRFSNTAIKVEVLSRFKTLKEQNAVLKELEQGKIDIIIGTHKLLSKSVKFKNLGLVIVDEEHRFGVRQKERLKELRAEVDLLTLTATPIPRTLNMAMEGMRELSIIATAPEHRLAVKTFVHQESPDLIREAIVRELRRGGQVYYLHNDVASIEKKAEELQNLVPEARIGIGHGQMAEKELQKVMRDFYHQRFNLLVCSTIIENGLDVPSANTIIIDRADRLGLAQLHQLRGRVGRSHHQAYAYLFTPPKELLSKNAKMRLEAIASMEELGSGFVLATHDLEIRGAGELLGEEQSGQIEAVGFSLYMQMLEEAVKALKSGKEPSLSDLLQNSCDVDLHLPTLFPDDYIGDISLRLSFYKRLSSCQKAQDFDDLKTELVDRFGDLPPESVNLFNLTKLKNLASSLGIVRILGDENGGVIEFGQNTKVNPAFLVTLITRCKNKEYELRSANILRYNLKESVKESRMELLKRLLLALLANSTLKEAE